jgi:hypothetical protein
MKSVYSTNFKISNLKYPRIYTGNLTLQFTKITRRLQQFTRRLQAKKAGSQLDRNVVYSQLWMDTNAVGFVRGN